MGSGRLVCQRLGVRAMMDAARMQRSHSGVDVVLTEEIAVVIEDEFVVIGIAMKERNSLSRGILFQRTRNEAADYGALGDERGMHAGREMGAVAHDRTNAAQVQLPN